MIEEWKWIKGYEGIYKISNTGKVKSYHRKSIILKPCLTVDGYQLVQLSKKGKCNSKYTHRLVAKYFCGGYGINLEVNHKDGDKSNNSASNLEWITHKENIRHSRVSGLNNAHGENHYISKLTKSDIKNILNLNGTMTQREIADMFNITQPVISDILNGKIWKQTIKEMS